MSSEKKKIIFIDELSWMDTQKSDLMVALENFWNGFASARKDIVPYSVRISHIMDALKGRTQQRRIV